LFFEFIVLFVCLFLEEESHKSANIDICKSGSDFLLDERTQLPKSCVPGAFYTCPQGYGCHSPPPGRGTAAGSGYCCRSELAVVVDIGFKINFLFILPS
jgi:hypothetical protein